MRIGIVLQPWDELAPPVVKGSVAVWTREVARRLAKTQEVIVYGPKAGRGAPDRIVADDVEYHLCDPGLDNLQARVARRLLCGRGPRRPFFWSTRFYHRYLSEIARDLATRPPDLIHVHNLASFAPRLRDAVGSARIVLHMHCDWLFQLDTRLTADHLRAVDLVLGCSEYVARRASESFPELHCRVSSNGVDPTVFCPSISWGATGPPEILFVGRLSPEKGIHVLCEACNQLVRQHPDLRLVVVGPEVVASRQFLVDLSDDPVVRDLARFYPGSYEKRCRELLEPALRDRATFTGFVSHDDLVKHYQQAAVVVNPSLSEAFGMSLVEGMACARPVVATRVGGMPEIVVEGQTGLIAEPGDVLSLTGALATLIRSPDERRRLGVAGRHRVETLFTWDRIVDELIVHYAEIVNG
jgi:glycosyltransferase involved in cell wall biosynthesis